MKFSKVLVKQILFRNAYSRYGKRAERRRVNLEYFNSEINLGDTLSPVICRWMLNKASLPYDKKIRHTRHLMAVGSILGGNGYFDATVWGSGIKSFDQICSLSKRKYFQKLDIRCVRGPLTRDVLLACGFRCPEIYGDPGILMPFIYKPEIAKTCRTGVILHFKHKFNISPQMKKINICTDDYEHFIDEILSCEKIISSSLHGIIIAEAYGVPAVFWGEGRDYEMFKYYDWYYSTGRKNIKVAYSFEEAKNMIPMELPDLSEMQKNVLDSFPYDLWCE